VKLGLFSFVLVVDGCGSGGGTLGVRDFELCCVDDSLLSVCRMLMLIVSLVLDCSQSGILKVE